MGIRLGDSNEISEQIDHHEPTKINNNALGEAATDAPNKVHQFYFVKICPHQKPGSDFEIQKAEKLIQELIQKLNRLELHLTKTLEIQSNQRMELTLANFHLKLEDSRSYSSHEALGFRLEELERLQEVLDRLCFGNKSYQMEKEKHHELDNHKLQYQMIHGCKSLAEENRQMRDIKESQRRGEEEHHMCRTISLGEVDWSDHWKYYETSDTLRNNGITDSDRDCYPREIKQLRLKVDKFAYNAALKGKSWNSLGLKQAIQDKIKIVRYDLEILENKRQELRAKLHINAKKWHALKKVRDFLNKELADTNQRKKEACQHIINLRKQYNKENACYHQNRLLLSKAMALASKKDVAALEKLSHTEVEKFMSHWNKNKAHRDDYKKRVLPSLGDRQLSSDGRMTFFGDEEPLVLVTPPSLKRGATFTIRELKCLMKENVEVRDPFEIGKGGNFYYISECSVFDKTEL